MHGGRKPHWWPEGEPWPPAEGGPWAGPPWWGPGWRRRSGLRRGLGCFVTLLSTLIVSIGVLVLWLLASLLGFVDAEGPLAVLARPAGLVVLVVGFVAIALGIRIARGIGPPLADLVDAARRIEAGDYSARVPEATTRRGDLRGLSRSFNAMAARLEAEDASRRRLLADVSHELRTPLAVIQGNLEALVDGVYPPDEAHIGPILEETRVLERLVDDLRTLSLAEAGALPLHRESTDPGVLLEDVAASHRARASAAGVTIRVEIAADLPPVDIDPTRMRQVLSNLVDNALRVLGDDGTIVLSAVRRLGDLQLEVADDGPGIPQDLIGSVFDRFAKSPESTGSGLGLSIARAVVEAHGGRIRAGVGPGDRGTAITISLPGA